ncbi:hypothetical protein SBOR_4058 [Sclerotinia borealis F-4128]|uniref:Dienelactone hydrolase domain-containing protein n=1 Tax=Sclerotinia borealis (strain F-4128) TaxID=1432307 RepID=W9CHX0_SCLBF|nr:hypothetical protein SBOR_4058 [Sclerotinia borealis F-4128]
MATQNACNTIPPVTKVKYKTKGTWDRFAELPVYVSGASNPKIVLMIIYDVFGAAPQTLQGTDLLAAALAPLDTVVIVPDLFNGKAAQAEWYNPDASEEAKAAKAVFVESAYTFETWENLAESIVIHGLCWGGKVVAATSGKRTPWTVSGQVHPGRLTKEDAEKITIPHIVLASNGEDAKVVQEYKDILEAGHGVVETYPTMHHGWMGTRVTSTTKITSRNISEGMESSSASSTVYKRYPVIKSCDLQVPAMRGVLYGTLEEVESVLRLLPASL